MNKPTYDELKAQVELFREKIKLAHTFITCADETGYIDDAGFVDTEALADDLESALLSKPAQCLAEIKAQAVEAAINLCQHSFGSWENVTTSSLGVADYELKEYANQLRQAAKAGE